MSDDFVWATVTAVSPLRIQLDGDTAPLPITPDSLIDPRDLQVNQRVRCERSSRRIVIHGRAGGGERVPAGCVMQTASTAVPNGWLLCDGSNVSRSTYADLFAAIGTTYGAGNGTTTFGLPDMRGRVAVGRDAGQTEFDVLGEAGGAKTHTLTASEMPAHTHDIKQATASNTATTGSGNRSFLTSGGSPSAATESAGGGAAHNNLQPYRVLNFIIKT